MNYCLKIVFSIPGKRSVIDYGALSVLYGSGLSWTYSKYSNLTARDSTDPWQYVTVQQLDSTWQYSTLTVRDSTSTGCQTKLDSTCKDNLKLVLIPKLVVVLYHLQLAKQLEVIGWHLFRKPMGGIPSNIS